MIEVMKKHNTTIPEPIPAKPLLLSLVGEANVPKQYIVDNNAKTSGYSVLQLSPYHCMLHPIEIVWSQTKQHYRRQNIYSNEPSNILESIWKVCSTNISLKNVESLVSLVIKEEEKFRKTDNTVDNEIEPVKSNIVLQVKVIVILIWNNSKLPV